MLEAQADLTESLREMLGPVAQHYDHKQIECAPVPNAVQLLINAEAGD